MISFTTKPPKSTSLLLSSIIIFCLFCFSVQNSQALDIEDEIEHDMSGQISIFGLVMNQTTSVPGNEFYRIFSSHWFPPKTDQEYNIFINDRVHPHLGTWLFIEVNEQTVHRVRLNNRNWEIEQGAKIAIGVVERYVVVNFSNRAMKNFDQDLVGDGL